MSTKPTSATGIKVCPDCGDQYTLEAHQKLKVCTGCEGLLAFLSEVYANEVAQVLSMPLNCPYCELGLCNSGCGYAATDAEGSANFESLIGV